MVKPVIYACFGDDSEMNMEMYISRFSATRMHVDFIPDNTVKVALLSVVNFNLYHAGFISG